MRQPHSSTGRWAVVAAVICAMLAAAVPVAVAQGGGKRVELPSNAGGSGMKHATSGPCKGRFQLDTRIKPGGNPLCTHGADPRPSGVSALSLGGAPRTASVTHQFTCDGNGVSGRRTQVLYVQPSGVTNEFAQVRDQIVQDVGDTDDIYKASAQDTGGSRRIRFVQDPSTCQPTVLNVSLPSLPSNPDFSATINALAAAGFKRADRRYLIFMDANALCGIATTTGDDQPGQGNSNNQTTAYARVDRGCWAGVLAAHEHMHTMGTVNASAPHHSDQGHCTDEHDVMCYDDSLDPVNHPLQMTYPCSGDAATNDHFEHRYDCNHDDYFNTNTHLPSTNYLSNHWNAVNNQFLVAPTHALSGHVRDPSGHPIVGARVTLPGTSIAATKTDSTGAYHFSGISETTYRYAVSVRAGMCSGATGTVILDANKTLDLVSRPLRDGFGYTCARAPFRYLPAALSTYLPDRARTTFNLPFSFPSFPFYGQRETSLSIASFGWLAFNQSSYWTLYPSDSIPRPTDPNNAIYPFWDDLHVDSSSGVFYSGGGLGTAPNRYYVVEWRNVRIGSDTTKRISFETILFEDGRILNQYKDIGTDPRERGSMATIGLENAGGTMGTQSSFHDPALTNNSAVMYAPPAPATTDDTSSAIAYTGTWQRVPDATAYGGSRHTTSAAGSSASFSFTGTGATLLTATGPSNGKAQVIVDGKPKATLDLYSAWPFSQYRYLIRGLPSGTHRVTLKALGTRNAGSTGTAVVFDGFRVP